MKFDSKKENKINGIILLKHNSLEFLDIIDFLNKIKSEEFSTVLYISLTRSYNYIKKAVELNPLENKRVFFIDCVTGYVFPEEDHIEECIYHKPPRDIKELKKIIDFGITKTNPDMIILDSLSQFIGFSKKGSDNNKTIDELFDIVKKESLNIVQQTFIFLYDLNMKILENLPEKKTDIVLKLEKKYKNKIL